MLVLLFTLLVLLMIIALEQLNPGTISVNFFGLKITNIPISLFMLLFIIVGILIAVSGIYLKYSNLKKQYLKLLEEQEQNLISQNTDKD